MNILFINGKSDYGGAIYAGYNCNINIDNCTFIGNNANRQAGAVYVNQNSHLSINNSVFSDNIADKGGAVYGAKNTDLKIDNSTFTSNEANDKGGAIFIDESSGLNINNCHFSNLIAEVDGGAIYGRSNVIVKRSTFNDTTANTGSGGAIYTSSGYVSVSNSTFINNKANCGGSIYMRGDGNLIVSESIFNHIVANIDGGAINANNIVVSSSTFIDTSAKSNGGVIWGNGVSVYNSEFINTSAGSSGGVIYGGSSVSVNDSKFTNTKANNGKYVYSEGRVTLLCNDYDGKTIHTNDNVVGNPIINLDCTFNDLANDISAGGNISLTRDYIQTDSHGEIIINKDTIINGNGHTIDAQGKSRIFSIANGVNVTIKNITFTNGKISEMDSNRVGGAICAMGCSLTVIDSTFINTIVVGSSSKGGAIYGGSGDVTVINSSFINTKARDYGGAIYISESCGSFNVFNSTFKNTNSDSAGAILISDTGRSFTIFGSTFTNVTANNRGGGIYNLNSGNFTVINSTFTNNAVGSDCGGAIYQIRGILTVINSTFNSCGVPNKGGAIYNLGNAFLIGSSFINSNAIDSGGAIYNSGSVVVTNSSFINIKAGAFGGAIYNIGSATVFGSTFINITTTSSIIGGGGAISNYNAGTLTVANSSFTNISSARDGGAIYNGDPNAVVANSSFTNISSARDGGAIYSVGGIGTMINSIFTHTSAVRYGGAIYVGGSVDVINSSFNDNSAKSMGASIYSKSTLNVENSTFNSPNVNGTSIIYQLSNNDISLINNTIQSNLLAIYTTNGKFVSPTILTFDNVTVDIGENSTLTATLTDDKGNIIGTDANIESKVGETNVNLAFNETTKKYNAIYNETSVRGQYTITGNYLGATSCNVNNGTLTVEGLHLDEFKVDINSKVYGNFSGNITVLSDNATGNVSIKVNGTKYGQVALVNGVANWLLTNVAPGNYIISFVYSGDNIYESATNSTIVDIDKASIPPADINTNVTDPAYGELTVEVNISGDVSGKVTVDDKNYAVNVTGGKAVF